MILRLNDGTGIEVLDSTTTTAICADVKTIETIDDITTSLSKKGNLDAFEYIQNGDVIGKYENYKYISTSYVTDSETGVYHAIFTIEPKTDIEIRLDTLEEGQELQNSAIDKLSNIIDA